ncbi:EscU/YscU/HrcU family type III secretion system export apparatus switch protein [Vibrio chagasii]|nr:EscU/YscU/HrcU family type III secretion system export apparatus switch protein [Vibrio chagasii]
MKSPNSYVAKATQRMMADVPQADVIVTNPELLGSFAL